MCSKEPQELIRHLLEKYDLSEAQICRASGLSPSQLSRYLNQTNKKDIYFSTILRIVKAFPAQARSEFWWVINSWSIDEQEAC